MWAFVLHISFAAASTMQAVQAQGPGGCTGPNWPCVSVKTVPVSIRRTLFLLLIDIERGTRYSNKEKRGRASHRGTRCSTKEIILDSGTSHRGGSDQNRREQCEPRQHRPGPVPAPHWPDRLRCQWRGGEYGKWRELQPFGDWRSSLECGGRRSLRGVRCRDLRLYWSNLLF